MPQMNLPLFSYYILVDIWWQLGLVYTNDTNTSAKLYTHAEQQAGLKQSIVISVFISYLT